MEKDWHFTIIIILQIKNREIIYNLTIYRQEIHTRDTTQHFQHFNDDIEVKIVNIEMCTK